MSTYSTTSGNTEPSSGSNDGGVIALVLIIVVVVLLVKFAAIYYICKYAQRRCSVVPAAPIYPQNYTVNHEMPKGIAELQQFTFDQIMQITENLRVKLGEGGFGPVHHGKLNNGKHVAVKRLSPASRQGATEFLNEVAILSRVHHKNLVSLVGYCYQFNERILVYEYMPKGTLHDHLHGAAAVTEPLDWLARLRIAVNAANGLKYLHFDCTPKIIHRDIKSTNILLDDKLNGKVGDFGLSKFTEMDPTHMSTVVKGTFGYLDPQYAVLERLTEKSDVYSFGIVLLELICGRKAVIEISTPEPEVANLKDWAIPHIRAGTIERIVDQAIVGSINSADAVRKVADVALRSVEGRTSCRPTSSEVLTSLEEALRLELSAISEIIIEESILDVALS